MRFPEALQAAIESLTSAIPSADLRRAALEISQQYSAVDFSTSPLRTDAHRMAYLLTRLPATYGACSRVLREIKASAPEASPHSLLDLGAGPGTATLAAVELFPSIKRCSAIESDVRMLAFAKQLLHDVDQTAAGAAEYMQADIASHLQTAGTYDLVVLSYSIGELPPTKLSQVLEGAWRAARQFLVIIEPGTPRAFMTMARVRTALLDGGAHIVAPCPHASACPWMGHETEWCHFSQRVERSAQHRRLKGGELPYEDEKFTYLIFAREPVPRASSRILRHPEFGKGHVKLTLCEQEGIEKRTVTKSQKEIYKDARHAAWGGRWE